MGLPLYIRLVEPSGRDHREVFSRGLQRVGSFASRLRSLYIETEGGGDDHPLIEFFRASPRFPTLQTLVVSIENDSVLPINLCTLPLLRTLNVLLQPLRAKGSSGVLEVIGCIILEPTDLASLVELVARQTISFHLTIFTNMTQIFPDPFPFFENSKRCWRYLASLRLDGLSSGDSDHSGTLFSQLHAPQLRRLELVDMDNDIVDILIVTLPVVTVQSVETLLISGVRVELKDDFASLSISNQQSRQVRAFPNMVELVVWDLRPEDLRWIGLSTIEKCLSSQRDTLKRLTLPRTFRPTSGKIRDEETLGVEHKGRNQSGPLTLREETGLIDAGNLDEIRYNYEIDDHNMALAPYFS
ncbi:hypothetical protein DL93DRAFT_2225179 [Clavulina sp. PMI_390]|nr:hypothetical protein DL93DRAFT_2225179 [Clavulina sp. PMI_390]